MEIHNPRGKPLTLPAGDAQDRPAGAAGQAIGFRLHADVAARADARDRLERLCRTRPAGGLRAAPVAHRRLGTRATN
jgi:hypothetical protein